MRGLGVTEGGQTFKTKNRRAHLEIVSSKHFWRIAYLETSKAPRELLSHLMPTGRYLCIPFLRTKSQMVQTKHWSSENSHKKDHSTTIIATNFV